MSETLRPLDSRIAPRDAAAIPFPNEETTPPVIKMYLVFAISFFDYDGITEYQIIAN